MEVVMSIVNWDAFHARITGRFDGIRQAIAKGTGDIVTGDLSTYGGYLSDADADKFIEETVLKSKLMKMGTIARMKSHTQNFPRVGFDSRISHAHGSGTSLPEAQRSKPDLNTVQIATAAFAAEVRIPDDVVEDAVSGEAFRNLVITLARQRIGADIEEIALRSDDSLADPDLNKFDGIIKSISTNTKNFAGANVTRANLKAMLALMPVRYKQDKSKMQFVTSPNALEYYEDQLMQLGLDPAYFWYVKEGAKPTAAYAKIPVNDLPVMPEDLSTDKTAVLLGDPLDIYWGFWRNIRVEFERVGREQTTIAIFSYRFGVALGNEEGWVKGYNVLPS